MLDWRFKDIINQDLINGIINMSTFKKNKLGKILFNTENATINDYKSIIKFYNSFSPNIYTNSFKSRVIGLAIYDLMKFNNLNQKNAIKKLWNDYSEFFKLSEESFKKSADRWYKVTTDCISFGMVLPIDESYI